MVLQFTFILNLIALALFAALLSNKITPPHQKLNSALLTKIIVSLAIAIFSYYLIGPFRIETICLASALISSYSLYKPGNRAILSAGTVICIVSLFGICQIYLLPLWSSILISTGVLLLSVLGTSSKYFIYSKRIREDALLLLLSMALLISVITPIEQGWQSAQTLNVSLRSSGVSTSFLSTTSIWLYVPLLIALSAGIITSLLKRHSTEGRDKKERKC